MIKKALKFNEIAGAVHETAVTADEINAMVVEAITIPLSTAVTRHFNKWRNVMIH